MSERWMIRLVLGYPLDDEDIDNLLMHAPELADEKEVAERLHRLFFPFWARRVPDEQLAELAERIRRASAKHVEGRPTRTTTPRAAATRLCPNVDCPLKGNSPKVETADSQSSEEGTDEARTDLIRVASASTTPRRTFMDMAKGLRTRTKKGVKRVIVTDPFIHLNQNEDGNGDGHGALLDFLRQLDLEGKPFRLELSPAPKKWNPNGPLDETPVGKKVLEKFPNATLAHHKQVPGGFHDRFYLVVDGSGTLDGLAGPSLNGLDAYPVVMLGSLEKEPCLKTLKDMLV